MESISYSCGINYGQLIFCEMLAFLEKYYDKFKCYPEEIELDGISYDLYANKNHSVYGYQYQDTHFLCVGNLRHNYTTRVKVIRGKEESGSYYMHCNVN